MKITITSGIVVNDNFYAKPKCTCKTPKLCSLTSLDEFSIINKIPTSGIPSGELPVFLSTSCPGTLPLLNNDLTEFLTSDFILNKEYEVFPICISGVVFGQVSN